jgi:hypothetical protein
LLAASAFVVINRYSAQDPEPASVAGACQTRDSAAKLPYGADGHPRKDFYEPTETAPLDDFGHVLGDGYVIVQYRPTLAIEELNELRGFISGPTVWPRRTGSAAQSTQDS